MQTSAIKLAFKLLGAAYLLQNDTIYKKLIGVTTCNIVGTQYW